MTAEDTIIAVASPRGRSLRGIVRLSGPQAMEVASRCLEPSLGEGTYLALERRFILGGTAPFPVAVYVMRAPKSYTREDVVEIHAFGSPPLLAAIVSRLCREGARLAEPGEFTRRAFLNGRIDLAQAEAVLAVIKARSDEEERLALSALAGNVSSEVAGIRKGLLGLAVDIEAGLDFFDEEAEFAPAGRQAEGVGGALTAVRELLEKSVTGAVFREEVVVVIYGAANAGKSTLFNMLAGESLAIVHETPGTTRDFLEAVIELDGIRFLLVDTAGVRPPAEVVERIAVERTRSFVREAQIVLFVVDGSAPPGPEVGALYGDAAKMPHVVALNKADRGLAVDAGQWRGRFGGDAVEISAATGAGRGALERILVDMVCGGRIDLSTARFLLAERQRRCLDEAAAALGRAAASIKRGDGDEIISLEIREAVSALGRVTGEDYVEDLLDEVFSRFCLGK